MNLKEIHGMVNEAHKLLEASKLNLEISESNTRRAMGILWEVSYQLLQIRRKENSSEVEEVIE